jgi:hypothetical protein
MQISYKTKLRRASGLQPKTGPNARQFLIIDQTLKPLILRCFTLPEGTQDIW